MLFEATKLADVFIINLQPASDERGFFVRSFCKKEFEKRGMHSEFVQTNLSFNHKQGTLRGLHYQEAPYEEVKIVSCRRGAIFDVVVDIRKKSATYGQWFGVELTQENLRSLYIPKGFAHGFQTLTDNAEVSYLMGNYYEPSAARGIRYDDPILNVTWPLAHKIVSIPDQHRPDFSL